MSAYENYDETSKKYDNARFAIAAPFVQQTFAGISKALKKPVSELVALEAGCGTGNYSVAMAEMGAGTVHAVDHNQGMLSVLQAKVDSAKADSPVKSALKVN